MVSLDQLPEDAAQRPRMEESDGAVNAGPRSMVDQLCLMRGQPIQLEREVVGRQTDVMQPLTTCCEEACDPARIIERLDELDPR